MKIKLEMNEAQKAFATLLNKSKRESAVTSAKRAGANVIRKAASKTTRFQDYTGTPRDRRRTRYSSKNNLRSSLKKAKTGLHITRNKNISAIAGAYFLAPHAHLVEFGHNSSRNGPVRGRHFMEYAARENTAAAFEEAKKAFVKSVERALRARLK